MSLYSGRASVFAWTILAGALHVLTVVAAADPVPQRHGSVHRIELIGTASIPGTARDKSGLPELLAGEFPHDRLGSFGSGIDYTGKDNFYIACSDRGPLDGATRFVPRVQQFHIRINETTEPRVSVELASTTLLTDEEGRPFTGFFGRVDPGDDRRSLQLDPEAVRVEVDGSFWIADEYGPWLDRFSAAGQRIQRLAIPPRFHVATPSMDHAAEMPPASLRGRQVNRGFEGLARSPDGTKLWAILQSPLIQDSALDERGKRSGLNIRILECVVAGDKAGTTRELVYQLEKGSNGVSEVLALSDHELLVLERDGEVGREAVWRRVYKIDLSVATDVSEIDSLPAEDLPASIAPVTKSRWLDLCDERYGLVGPGMPEKIEGLALGPSLDDGRRTLLVSTDNDLQEAVPSYIWVFAWSPTEPGQKSPKPVNQNRARATTPETMAVNAAAGPSRESE